MRTLLILVLLFGLSGSTFAGELEECVFTKIDDSGGILIAWKTSVRKTGPEEEIGPFRPLALIDGINITETKGSWIYEGQSFWPVLSPDSEPVNLSSINSFLDRMGDDHCVYHGTFAKEDLPRWTLLSSKPLQDIFKVPS